MASSAQQSKKGGGSGGGHRQIREIVGDSTHAWLERDVFTQFTRDKSPPSIIFYPPVPLSICSSKSLFAKSVIMWAPDATWKSYLGPKFIKCSKCNKSTSVKSHGWSPDPRIVYDISDRIWLISRRYNCTVCKHIFNAHDKEVCVQLSFSHMMLTFVSGT